MSRGADFNDPNEFIPQADGSRKSHEEGKVCLCKSYLLHRIEILLIGVLIHYYLKVDAY